MPCPRKILIPCAFAIISINAYASCGSSFCPIYNHWDTHGLNNSGGLNLDVRYSQYTADVLRAGHKKINSVSPSGSDEEIEDKRTRMRLITLDLDYAFVDSPWNIGIMLPVIAHDHTHTFDSSVAGAFEQQSKFSEIGDIRLFAKYQLSNALNFGNTIRLGIKLPTGATNKTLTPEIPEPITDEHHEGEEGHEDAATPEISESGHHEHGVERAIQPGTGSTDLILGYYYFNQAPGKNWGWFISGQIQAAVQIKDDYRPGTKTNFDFGASYALAPQFTGLLQINLQHQRRDSGANANLASGGHSINFSPGLAYSLNDNTRIYGFVQIAAHQYTKADPETGSGQLTAPWSFSLGVNHRF